jgi:hypothetical protein
MKHVFILFFLISILSIRAMPFANGVIKGTLVDDKKAPILFATIVLKNSTDSSLYKGEITNELGEFVFENVKPGTYFIEIGITGFEKYVKLNIDVNNEKLVTALGDIQLFPASNSLKVVTVTAEKPFIEKQAGKTVINIENSIVQSGTSVLEMMEKLPGVQVTDQDQIVLKGKQDVNVYIDGKSTMLSADNLAGILRGMSSSSVEKIEIITNPSAKYDASGSAGVINIITKKNKEEGLNGTVNAGYGQGRYDKENMGLLLSKKNKSCNLFLNYTFSKRKNFNDFRLKRTFPTLSNPDARIESNSHTIDKSDSQSPRLGADFYLSKKTTLSLVGSGLMHKINAVNNSHSDFRNPDENKINSIDFINRLQNNWNSYTGSANITTQLDTNGRSISADIDYADFSNKINQVNISNLNDGNDNFINQLTSIGDQDINIAVYSAKTDYSQKLGKKETLETGLKFSYVNSNSDSKFFNNIANNQVYDSTKSNHFIYSENINAAYIDLNGEHKKISFQLGVRAEQTVVNGEQLLTGKKLTRNYLQLFPSAFFDYKKNEDHDFCFNIGRRIDRPPYNQMDPYRILTDVGTYSQGNPGLRPELTTSSYLNYTYKNIFFVTLNGSITHDKVVLALLHDVTEGVTLRTFVNVDRVYYYSLDLLYSKKLTSWWRTSIGAIPYYQIYKGQLFDFTIKNSTPASFQLHTSNSITLVNDFSVECNFVYQHKFSTGISIIKPHYNLSLGVKKMFWDKRASLSLNVNDVLWSDTWRGTAYFGTSETPLVSNFIGIRETRVANLMFSYRFGQGKVGKSRRTSVEENEKNRININ